MIQSRTDITESEVVQPMINEVNTLFVVILDIIALGFCELQYFDIISLTV